MNELTDLLRRLCNLPSVSGREGQCHAELFEIARPYFDEVREDGFGNAILIKKSAKQNAPKLMLDAHLDEVGMMVSEVHENGFLSVVAIGGLDTRVLGATEVTVYGKREIYGVITSVPPHILDKSSRATPKMTELYIDTGYDGDTVKELVSVGDVVEYRANFTTLENNRVLSKSLDDKACVCALFTVAMLAEADKLEFDLYVVVSAQEETGKNGARLVAYGIEPDIAIITDVNFARAPGVDECDSIEMGKGASVDISALTHIPLTRKIMAILDRARVPYQRVCEPSRTSTNNDGVSICAKGVRTALMSVPLSSMHTPCEVVCLDDIASMARNILEIAYTPSEELL